MRGLLEHTRIALRLTARNRMALFYGYLLPVIFFLSFVVLYRSENPLLIRHMGELLTVGVLGTACFGLPTSLVSERERGIWRRYRITPAATGSLVTSTLLVRYVTVLGAGLLQLFLAMAIGGWAPAHPFDLWLTYSLVTFALLGLGLVLTALADTVPAAQAIGQCIFLPMLIVGGVAVRLEVLPSWLLPVTAFLPGRYAVEAMQACVNGAGLGAVGFHLAALLLIGAACCLVGVKLFRWDSEVRFLAVPNKSWVIVALASWIVVGGVSIQRGEFAPRASAERMVPGAVPTDPARNVAIGRPPDLGGLTARQSDPNAAPATRDASAAPAQSDAGTMAAPPGARSAVVQPGAKGALPASAPSASGTLASGAAAATAPAAPTAATAAEPWRALTQFDFAKLPIDQMPPDDGNVSPIATEDEAPVGSSLALLKRVEAALPTWAPGHVADRAQRVRNYLLLLGVADFAQSPVERFLPRAVLTHMLREFPPAELAQLVCWVALHADEGDVSALKDPLLVGLGAANLEPGEVRTRTHYYGVKFTRWIIGW
jgi:hypothetical protein